MSNDIITQWLNLPQVSVSKIDIVGNTTIIYLVRENGNFVCSCCRQTVGQGYDCRTQYIRDLSCFEYNTYLCLDKFRIYCPSCGVRVEELSFARVFSHCTVRFEDYIAKLCSILPVSQVAELTGLDWKTVKEIDKRYLTEKFSHPDYSCLELLAIDEISYKSGHKYLTIVLDLIKTRVVWVGQGRSKATLDKFFCEIGADNAKNICAIATDMWDPYLASICQYAPQAKVVFDKFHVIAEYNRMIDRIRNEEYSIASKSGKKAIKGSRYLLLTNEQNLGKDQKERLKELLDVNETISTAYILKDELKMLWQCNSKEEADSFLVDWVGKAIASENKDLSKFSKKLMRYSYGLINHAIYPINSARLEGVNNKIKVIKRRSYGFHDLTYFILKIKQGFT
jgi:transposase